MKRLLLVAVLAVCLVGCGDDEETQSTTVETTPGEVSHARVYFLRDGQVWPVAREVPEDGDAARHILDALAEGPSETETAELSLTSDFPGGVEATIAGGVATVETEGELTTEQRAQLVYSLTQLEPAVRSVEIAGESYTRADFEEQTPSVLVESPLAFQGVSAPFTVTGTANTFEANFLYELLDANGAVVDEDFVTATSGTGTRGTFEFTTADAGDVAVLVVFEESAEDGSRMREVRIPLATAS